MFTPSALPALKIGATMPGIKAARLALNIALSFVIACCCLSEKPLYPAMLAFSSPSESFTSIAAAGDWGCRPETSKTVGNMLAKNPSLVLALGDYSYEDSADCWLDLIEPLRNKTKIAIGNHDVTPLKLGQYMSSFGLNKQYYSFDYNNIHFLAMSTELPLGTNSEQFQFVTSDLRSASSNPNLRWIIVFFHSPLYSSAVSSNTLNSEAERREELRNIYHPIFSGYDVDLVLVSHNHIYERTYPLLFDSFRLEPVLEWWSMRGPVYQDPRGQIFVTVGTGGQSIFTVHERPSYFATQYEGYGFLHFNVTDSSIDAKFYANNGTVKDEFSVLKGR